MNKLTTTILLVITIGITNQTKAQTTSACSTENHQKFDFWVGDWNVYDTLNNKVGENLIVKLEDGCIINEHWKSTNGSTGRSYNYYDASDSTWNQLWIDNQGSNLVLKGHPETNKMVLKSELIAGKKIDWYYNRIIWEKLDDKTVIQTWDVLDKKNNILTTAFKGIYKRKE
ncbi:MAG: hypothetical protein AB7O47_12870 [Flavobacteriales bacterium]